VETEVSPSNFIFSAKASFATLQFRPPSKMKFERLTFAGESGGLKTGANAQAAGLAMLKTPRLLLF
jgi:hypothetical protein